MNLAKAMKIIANSILIYLLVASNLASAWEYSPTLIESYNNICEKIQRDEFFIKFAKTMGDAERSGNLIERYESETPLMDTKDKLLNQWVDENWYNKFYGNSVESYQQAFKYGDTNGGFYKRIGNVYTGKLQFVPPSLQYSIGQFVNPKIIQECGEKLLMTDFAYVFFARSKDPQNGRNQGYLADFSAIANLREEYKKYRTYVSVNERSVDANGNIVENKTNKPNPEWDKFRDQYFESNNHLPLLALVIGGEKVLSAAGNEFLQGYETALNKRKQEIEERKLAEQREKEAVIAKEKAEKLKIAKEKQDRADKLAALVARAKALKSGQASVGNFEDAILFYGDEKGNLRKMAGIAFAPLLTPDGLIYQAGADSPMKDYYETNPDDTGLSGLFSLVEALNGMKVDFQESDGTIRCIKNHPLNSNQFAYVFLRLNKNSRLHGNSRISIGSTVRVIGKYVGNKRYSTVSGTGKTAPVFEVLHYTTE